MIIEKRLRSDAGSCNFHDGFKFSYNVDWDHEEVYEIHNERNGCIKVRICQKCLNELLTKSCLDKLTE